MTLEPARRILFVDPVHGARSQMAAALLRAAAGNRFEVWSAGTAATGSLDSVDTVLEEVGIRDFRAQACPISTALTPPADLVVVVCEDGCDACPFVPGAKRIVRWPQPDPDAAPHSERLGLLRRIRQNLQLRIAYLVNLPESWTFSAG